jgi:hypothetical protein
MQIDLQVSLSSVPPSEPNLAAETAKNYRAKMEKAGFKVGPGGAYTFVITSAPGKAEGTMQLRQDGKGPEVTVPITAVDIETNLMSSGQSLWKQRLTLTNHVFGFEFLKAGEDITTHLANKLWGMVSQTLKSLSVPKQVFSPDAGAGVGRSVFVPGGAQPVAN